MIQKYFVVFLNSYFFFVRFYLTVECSGTVRVFSDEHNWEAQNSSSVIKQHKRQKWVIKKLDPKTKELLAFSYVEVTGNCCWNCSNRNRGGQTFDIATPGVHEPGWPIKKVHYTDC